uniref:ribonuclease H n=1 Tax=Astyanax mexicanus TaxID=7994 RepID=A0A3B1JLN1_ASTMX
MDAADTTTQGAAAILPVQLVTAVTEQGKLLGEHHQTLQHLGGSMAEIRAALENLTSAVATLGASAAADTSQAPASSQATPITMATLNALVPRAGCRLDLPTKYDGMASDCRGFLLQCSLYFTHQPAGYISDVEKIATVISLLKGKALEWATAVWEQAGTATQSYERFESLFRSVFDNPPDGKEGGEKLLKIRQGGRTAAEYALEFRTVAAASGWNDSALVLVFQRGLREEVQKELACRDDDLTLERLIGMAIRLDNLIRERYHSPRSYPEDFPEPMQLGTTRLSNQERARRHVMGLCLYCGTAGHLIRDCVSSPKRELSRDAPPSCTGVSVQPHTLSLKPFTVPITVHCLVSSSSTALLDSGAAGNFIDEDYAQELKLQLFPLKHPLNVQAIDSQPVGHGKITHITEPVLITVGAIHQEFARLLVTVSPVHKVILGLPWLEKHNPAISWRDHELATWSTECLEECLRLTAASTTVESPVIASIPQVPRVYSDVAEVFSKRKATQLPPHRSYDCAIDLKVGAPLPKAKVYSLSRPETAAMEEYINEALRQGFIRPSTSPASSGFFFVQKKDGGLRPCIDYRQLNSALVKYSYPLPLVPATLEQIRGARIFTKLDLRSAYNLIRIREGDEWKTAFSTTTGHFEYLVMPYGLSVSPSVFQAMVNDVLRDMIGHFVIIFIDDILIYSRTEVEHVQHVRKVLKRLLQMQLYVKAEKCLFHQSSVSFLGYVLSEEVIKMDSAKVEAVLSWPTPRTVKELQRFLGFANFYRRFIRGFSAVAAPLTSALKGGGKRITWDEHTEHAFQTLKDRFTSAPILRHPDPEIQFLVEVDASEVGVGAVLSQCQGMPPKLYPCAFFSRKLSEAEKNYDIGNRELLAVKLALEEWRHWLEGAKMPFVVFTDHKNLEYIRTAKRLNPRQASVF